MGVNSEEKIKAGLERVKAQNSDSSASENVKKFYIEHEPYITSCHNYYLQYKSQKTKYIKNAVFEHERFQEELVDTVVLVLTANPIEEGILLHSLVEMSKEKLSFYVLDDYAYHICHIYGHTVVHMHAAKTGEEYTRRTINAANKFFQPNAIVLLGICYGIDFHKYSLGNVIISSGLKTYRLNFRDSEDSEETIFEAEEEDYRKPNNHLLMQVHQVFSYIQIFSAISEVDGSQVSVTWETGTMLSSNSLMSSKKVKEAVINALGTAKPKPLGGEMEGGGLLKTKVVEEQELDRWLIIKSICDWGEKKNLLADDPNISERMKDGIQSMAMVHSWSVFAEMLLQGCFKR